MRAPESAEKTALTARLDGVDGGKALQRAARRRGAGDRDGDRGEERGPYRAGPRPGARARPAPAVLIEVEKVTSTATCEAGKAPVADANLLGAVTVLGKKVTLTTGGPTEVNVPGVGEVRLDLSRTQTTSRTAAATALELKVSVNRST